MTGAALYGATIASFFFPGFGQGLAFRRIPMLALAAAAVATTFAIVWSMWFVPVTLALRLAGAIDAYRKLGRQMPPVHRVLGAVAIVIGAVGVGYVKLALEGFRIPSSSMYPTLVSGDHIYVDKLSPRWRPIERGEVIVFDSPCAQRPYVKRVIAVGGDTVEVRCSVVYVNGAPIERALVADKVTYNDREDFEQRWYPRESSAYRETHGGHRYGVFQSLERPAQDRAGEADSHDFPGLDRLLAPSCQHGDAYPPTPGRARQPTGTIVVTKPGAATCEPQAHFVVPPDALFVMGDNRNNANDSRYWGAVATDAVIGRVIGIWLTTGGQHGRLSRFGAIE